MHSSPQELAFNKGKSFSPHFKNILAEIPFSEVPISQEQIELIDTLVQGSDIPWEDVSVGDTGEGHFLRVGRLVTSPPGCRPKITSQSSKEILDAMLSPELLSFYQGILNSNEEIFCRCAQINVLPVNGFVGEHIDDESDPDYIAVAILHLNSTYSGGSYVVVSESEERKISFSPVSGTLMVGRTDLRHWVEPVTSGLRKTLVMFLSHTDGVNRKED